MKLSENFAIVGRSNPKLVSASGTEQTDRVSMALHPKVSFVVLCGGLGTAVTIQVKQAKTSGGGSEKDLTGKVLSATTGDHNEPFVLDVDASELDLANGFNHVSALLTMGSGSSGSYVSTVILADSTYLPATDDIANR